MQLKIRRSQKETGILSKTAVFCLDARVGFTEAESRSINRYKLGTEIIYSSQANQKYGQKMEEVSDGSTRGGLKALAYAAMTRLTLTVTVSSLSQGQHIECKSLDELLGAEEAIMTACRNLRTYLDTAATFDGREVLFNFSESEGEQVIAKAVAPDPELITESPSSDALETKGDFTAPEGDEPLKVHPLAAQHVAQAETVTEEDDLHPVSSEPIHQKNVLIGIGVLIVGSIIYASLGTKKVDAGSLTGSPPAAEVSAPVSALNDVHPSFVITKVPDGYRGAVWLLKNGDMVIPEVTTSGYVSPCPDYDSGPNMGEGVTAFQCQ